MIILGLFLLMSILSLIFLNFQEKFLIDQLKRRTMIYEEEILGISNNLKKQEFNPKYVKNQRMLNQQEMDKEILDYRLKFF